MKVDITSREAELIYKAIGFQMNYSTDRNLPDAWLRDIRERMVPIFKEDWPDWLKK